VEKDVLIRITNGNEPVTLFGAEEFYRPSFQASSLNCPPIVSPSSEISGKTPVRIALFAKKEFLVTDRQSQLSVYRFHRKVFPRMFRGRGVAPGGRIEVQGIHREVPSLHMGCRYRGCMTA